jgi:hypothetical protein
MKHLLFFLLLICVKGTFAQTKTPDGNLIIISIDGLRWGEVFKGAEKGLLLDKKFNSQDSAERFKKYWSDDVQQRRINLMPFLWGTIARNGQIYGNRDLGK